MSIADEGFPSLKHHRMIRAVCEVFELPLPVSHVHPREGSKVMKKGVFSNVHTKLNIWVSLAFQRDVTMSEYNVSGVVWIKQAKINHCSVSCMTSEPELQEISHCPSIAKSSRTACAFFLC